ncbi:twin-arginine translocase TatA/TatE family subunit [bacterium]|nr:twin-arginine translocase TatA/TatE family subunit [bacterium]
MGEFSLSHMLILALILLIFFGPSRLPALGQSLGKAIRGFKEGLNEMNVDAKDVSHQKEIHKEASKTEEKTEHKS